MTPQPQPHPVDWHGKYLRIERDAIGTVRIYRHPFETVFDSFEMKDIETFLNTHTPQPQHPQEEFYWLTKSQLDTLLLDLEYHRYNLARQTEEAIRSQKCASHSSAGAQQRIEQVINILEMQIGCSNMLWEDGGDSKEDAYHQLVDECRKALTLLQAGDRG